MFAFNRVNELTAVEELLWAIGGRTRFKERMLLKAVLATVGA